MSENVSEQTESGAVARPEVFDPERIIAELEQAFGRLPEAAIRQTQKHRDLMVPRLIQAIQDATAKVRAGEKVDTNAHFFALFLLAEFGAREALPAILEAISLPGEGPHDLFGSAITENLAGILMALSDDPLTLIDSLIRNADLNEYVRWEAAQAHSHLVRSGRMRREEAVESLRQHLRREIDKADGTEVVTGLVNSLYELGPNEAYEEIKEAFEHRLVEAFTINMKDIDYAISAGEEHVQQHLDNLRVVGDTIEELRRWAAFMPEPPARLNPKRPALAPMPEAGYGKTPRTSQPGSALSPGIPATQPATAKRAGRNDPCPCGSGKKYKKCCLDKDAGR